METNTRSEAAAQTEEALEVDAVAVPSTSASFITPACPSLQPSCGVTGPYMTIDPVGASSVSSCSQKRKKEPMFSSNGLMTREEVEQREISCLSVVMGIGQHPTVQSVVEFVRRVEGDLLVLSWPEGFVLIFDVWEEVVPDTMLTPSIGPITCPRWLKSLTNLLCCPEDLVPVGFVASLRSGKRRNCPRILYGLESGAIYAVNPERPAAGIVRIAESFVTLVTMGLVRMYNLYTHPYVHVPPFITAGPDLEILARQTTTKGLFDFGRLHQNIPYSVCFPPPFSVFFGSGGAEPPPIPISSSAVMIHLFRFGQSIFSCSCGGVAISGRVYGSSDNNAFFARDENTGYVVFLAADFKTFMAVGLRPFFENYQMQRTNIPQRAVVCHRCGLSRYNTSPSAISLNPRFKGQASISTMGMEPARGPRGGLVVATPSSAWS